MQVGLFLDRNNIGDIRSAIAQLREWESALTESDTPASSLREILRMPSAKLVRLAHEYFATGRFDLHQLAERSGLNVRTLHGMTGALGKACDSRGVEIFDRHGGQPRVLSIRQDVSEMLGDESGLGTAGRGV